MSRLLTYAEAIREAQTQLLEEDASVYLLGLGVPTPTGVFGTTVGLVERFGPSRILDLPASENGMTGMALGTAIMGMRPIMIHHRVDFAVLSLEPIVNQAAKWHYMYGGNGTAPLTIRLVIGRGWGQGPQHSQSLQSWFAHVPGLQVLMPTTPSDAKGMLIAAVRGEVPTVILEHRWLYGIEGEVASEPFEASLGEAAIRRTGTDITLIGTSYMVLECIAAANRLDKMGISAEVVDLRSISPLDSDTCLNSVSKTRRFVVADTGHAEFGVTAEVVARICTKLGDQLLANPSRVALPPCPTPTTWALANAYYPTSADIVEHALKAMGLPKPSDLNLASSDLLDVPNPDFKGPY